MTRLGWRLKRLEEVIAPAGNEPITIKVNYVDVNGQTTGGYEVVVPSPRRTGLAFGEFDPLLNQSGVRP